MALLSEIIRGKVKVLLERSPPRNMGLIRPY